MKVPLPIPLRVPPPLESASQKAYFEWVKIKAISDWRYLNITSSLNGAFLGGGRKGARQWSQLKAMGASEGFPDVIGSYPKGDFHGFFIEHKRLGNKPSKKQNEWAKRLMKAGYACYLSYSADESMMITEKWMGEE